MRSIGIVSAADKTTAVVTVRRMSACSGCHKANPGWETEGTPACTECTMFSKESVLTVHACNAAGAVPGDRVQIETKTGPLLFYAAAVFLFPLLAALLSGIFFHLWLDSSAAPVIGAAAGFLAAFLLLRLVVEADAKKRTMYTVTRILAGQTEQNGDRSQA